MKKISLAKASRSLAQYTSELTDDVLVVTEGDRPLAALVPLGNVDKESLALSTHPEFMKLVNRSRNDFEAGKIIPLDKMRSRVERMRSPVRTKRLKPTSRRSASTKRKRNADHD